MRWKMAIDSGSELPRAPFFLYFQSELRNRRVFNARTRINRFSRNVKQSNGLILHPVVDSFPFLSEQVKVYLVYSSSTGNLFPASITRSINPRVHLMRSNLPRDPAA